MTHEQSPPPSALARRRSFILGRSRDGSWIVREIGGFVAATFTNRSEAIRFAQSESGHRRGAVVLGPFAGVRAGQLEELVQRSSRPEQPQPH
ncbi:hypothetical protein FG93_04878 [Bosea sp. LC85]|uniref:hypothetical protein n=1 Tax=Bosea sp. LC85 TaxID=1502851 RepID=UPI0004E36A10|nr:hypothetical protein [Bosea sp. LC85]KFC65337.1 hypothetical protein FG93_04878 [Bosea sp. LC85]